MATRGYIGRLNADGTITTVFCQSNNYPEANGRLLATHYTDPAKVDALLALDSICEVGLDIGEAHDWADAPARLLPGGWLPWCQSFARDRGDRRLVAQTIAFADWPALAAAQDAVMAFLFDGVRWRCAVVSEDRFPRRAYVPHFGPWYVVSVEDGQVVLHADDTMPYAPPSQPPLMNAPVDDGMVSICVIPREVTEQLLQNERERMPNW